MCWATVGDATLGLGTVLAMLIGAAMVAVAVLGGNSSVMMTSYPPLEAAPPFLSGLDPVCVGALIGCFVFLGTLVVAKREKHIADRFRWLFLAV